MKNISEIAGVSCINKAREEQKEKEQIDQFCYGLVSYIFIKFALLFREYDALYSDTRRENAEKTMWAIAFAREGIRSHSDIKNAMVKAEYHSKYGKPPSLGQFLNWCSEKFDYEFPSSHVAYKIASMIAANFDSYVHDDVAVDTVIRHAIRQIGLSQFRAMSEIDAKKFFFYNYDVSCRQFKLGNLQAIKHALPEKKDTASEKRSYSFAQAISEHKKRAQEAGLTDVEYAKKVLYS